MTGPSQPKVIVIGVDPSTLDPLRWGVTPEQNARVQTHIVASEQGFIDSGYDVEMCLLALDADLESVLVPRLQARSWDVVVIGGGLRKPPELLGLFEQVVNAVHRHAPQAAMAFNDGPTDSQKAAERWVAVI